jgi:hypothetical protein
MPWSAGTCLATTNAMVSCPAWQIIRFARNRVGGLRHGGASSGEWRSRSWVDIKRPPEGCAGVVGGVDRFIGPPRRFRATTSCDRPAVVKQRTTLLGGPAHPPSSHARRLRSACPSGRWRSLPSPGSGAARDRSGDQSITRGGGPALVHRRGRAQDAGIEEGDSLPGSARRHRARRPGRAFVPGGETARGRPRWARGTWPRRTARLTRAESIASISRPCSMENPRTR